MSEFYPPLEEDEVPNYGKALIKRYTYNEIHELIRNCAFRMKTTNAFRPDYILAIGGGGFVPARILRTYLDVPILATSICFYDDSTNEAMDEPRIIQEVDPQLIKGKRVLIVDEVDDTGKTLDWLLKHLPKDAEYGIFVVHSKNKLKFANLPRDIPYIACQTTDDIWIEYPWDTQ